MPADLTATYDPSIVPRALLAFALCAAGGLLIGNRAIEWLRARFREPIKSISPTVERLHSHKAHTPTMGGLFITAGVLCVSLLCTQIKKPEVAGALFALVGFATVGAVDDLVKLRSSRRGISARGKLLGQMLVAIPLACWLANLQEGSALSIIGHVLILLAAANAVNVTDGLDGLAGGLGALASAAIAIVLLLTAKGELAIVAAALAGALIAFLWYNRHPARVFMGDTGSQAIGAVLGYLMLAARQEWLLAVVGGVFLVELLSVVLQLGSYRFRGQRLFLCAPLHHHFQFAGWAETRIVKLFWTAGIACAVVGVIGQQVARPRLPASDLRSSEGNLATTSRVQPLTHDMAADRANTGQIATQERFFQ